MKWEKAPQDKKYGTDGRLVTLINICTISLRQCERYFFCKGQNCDPDSIFTLYLYRYISKESVFHVKVTHGKICYKKDSMYVGRTVEVTYPLKQESNNENTLRPLCPFQEKDSEFETPKQLDQNSNARFENINSENFDFGTSSNFSSWVNFAHFKDEIWI